jgi:hypothetical protein
MKYKYKIVEYDGHFYAYQKMCFLGLGEWGPLTKDGGTGSPRWPYDKESRCYFEKEARDLIDQRKLSHRQWEATRNELKRKHKDKRVIKVR